MHNQQGELEDNGKRKLLILASLTVILTFTFLLF